MRVLVRILAYVTVIALPLTGIGACASKKEYDASVARGDSLQAANTQLQAQYDSLQTLFAQDSLDMNLLRDGIQVVLPADLLFESGSLQIRSEQHEFGMKLAGYLKGNDYLIFVTGYTDSQKPVGGLAQRYPTNWELSAARAALAVRFLVENGVAPERLWAIGRAANDPVASNATPEGRAENRRLKVVLRPKDLVYTAP